LGLPDELPSASELTPDVVEALCELVDKLETRFAELEGNQLYDVLASLMDTDVEHRKFMTATYTFLRRIVKKKDMLKLRDFLVNKVLPKGQ
jgi:SPX domain protein involved in polyphosphate accumulation